MPYSRGYAVVPLVAAVIGLAAGAPQNASSQEPLARVNVDLVQVDVVVTDRAGNHMTDLAPDDFEILENGKPQHITNFSFIAGGTGAQVNASNPRRAAAGITPIGPADVKRTVAVVVDDLGISEHSFAALHVALERFVETQVQPGDLVAIITTSGRLGALQQATSDQRLLRAAVAKLRSLPNHRPGIEDDDFTCVWFNHRSGPAAAEVQDEDVWLGAQRCLGCPRELDPQQELINDHRADFYGRLTIAALRRVVEGMRELPGRKSILLFSEGAPLVRGQGLGDVNELLKNAYNDFLIYANRSGVAINTIDPRGLVALSSSAASGHSSGDGCTQAREAELINTQQELAEIARKTGGISIKDDNDLSGAIARVMDDQLGYYLIGYKPSGPAPRLRKLSVRLARPGLKARFYSNLYAVDNSSPANNSQRLAAAVASPFAIPGIHVRISTRYWDAGAPAGSILDTVVLIDAHDLDFSTEGDGRRKAVFEILAVIYGSEDKPLDTFDKSYTVTLTEDAYQKALADGLIQRLELAVKKPGPYQIRAAVRDQHERTGSASDFVEVPDLSHGGLTLSGIALSDSPGAPSQVRYHPGSTVFYASQVLNASPDADGAFHVEVRAALYRDGRALGSSKPILVDAAHKLDPKRLLLASDFRLGKQLSPGDYSLQLTAVDKNAPPKRGTCVESIDFEVRP